MITCGGTPIPASPSTVASVTVASPAILTTTPGSACGPGPVSINLGATTNAGSTIDWYDAPSGGTSLGTGTAFATPPITTTTTYYAEASVGGVSGNVGPLSPAIGTQSSSNIAIGTQGMFFDVIVATTLLTVDIFPTAAIGSAGSVEIRTSGGTTVPTYRTVTTVTGGEKQTVTMNVMLPVGTGYRIGQGTAIQLLRNTTGAVYPYTSAAINITGNTFDPVYYYFYYNWSFSSTCNAPRIPVVATVLNDPPTCPADFTVRRRAGVPPSRAVCRPAAPTAATA